MKKIDTNWSFTAHQDKAKNSHYMLCHSQHQNTVRQPKISVPVQKMKKNRH